jgi:hypothetical protein
MEPEGAGEPALNGLGPVAAIGWAAIGLAMMIAAAAGAAAAGGLDAAWFGAAAAFALAAAALLLALAAWRTARILRASRR